MVNKIMLWFIFIFIEPSRSLHYKFQHSSLIVMKTGMLQLDIELAEAGAGRAVPGLLEAAAEGEKEAPDSRKKPRSPPEAPTHSCIYDGKKGTHPVPFVF